MSVLCDAEPYSELHRPMAEPASGPQRSRPASASGKAEKERRKRSRVTPEQLVHLERFFSLDRSPTAARRKEISTMLGMQERQTQIWFQNRRAKAKLQDGKKGRGSSSETPPDTPPQLVTGYEAELHNLLHEDEPVTIIPCTNLSVGTWRRVTSASRKHDLVAYLSDYKRCLTWYIHSSGFGFKMEIPFDTIINTEFTNAAPGSGLASFFLSQPPTFYLEILPTSDTGQTTEHASRWKKCADWTEHQQATKVLRHDLVGSAVQLAHILRHLNAHTSGSDIRLHSPSYNSQKQSPPILEIQPPPLTTVAGGARYHYHPQDGEDPRQPDHLFLAHKQSFSPLPSQQLSLHDESPQLPGEPTPPGVISEPDLPIYPQYAQQAPIGVNQLASYSDHAKTALSHHVSRSSFSADCGSSQTFSTHGPHQRPYSAGSVHSLSYESDTRILSFPDSFQTLGNNVPTSFGKSSPPLLTTPFYPVGSHTAISYDPTVPVISFRMPTGPST